MMPRIRREHDETVEFLWDATQRGHVPGRQSFRGHIAAALGRRVAPLVLGRPRKPVVDEATDRPAQERLL
jgi:hypothetical protein